jgi:hypothetical protein
MIEHRDISMGLLRDGTRNPTNPSRWHLKNTILRSKFSLFVAVATGIWLYFTISFAWALSSESQALGSSTNPTNAIRILSIFSEGVTLLLPLLVAATSSIASWASASSKKGVSLSTWLSMSPATSLTGLMKLFWWHKVPDADTRDWHHQWIIARLGHRKKISYV